MENTRDVKLKNLTKLDEYSCSYIWKRFTEQANKNLTGLKINLIGSSR